MSMKTTICLLLVIGTATLAGAFSRPDTHITTSDDFRFEATQLKDKSLWTQVNSEPFFISAAADVLCRAPMAANYESERKINPHVGTSIIVYVNNIGREAMLSKEAKTFPVGSVIVKEKTSSYFEGRKILLYTIMKKREPGFNPVIGDWEFAVVGPNGTEVKARGKLENCQACHASKHESDFIFRPYLRER